MPWWLEFLLPDEAFVHQGVQLKVRTSVVVHFASKTQSVTVFVVVYLPKFLRNMFVELVDRNTRRGFGIFRDREAFAVDTVTSSMTAFAIFLFVFDALFQPLRNVFRIILFTTDVGNGHQGKEQQE